MRTAQDAELLGLLDGIGYRPARAFGGSSEALIGCWTHGTGDNEKHILGRAADLSSAEGVEDGGLNNLGHCWFSPTSEPSKA